TPAPTCASFGTPTGWRRPSASSSPSRGRPCPCSPRPASSSCAPTGARTTWPPCPVARLTAPPTWSPGWWVHPRPKEAPRPRPWLVGGRDGAGLGRSPLVGLVPSSSGDAAPDRAAALRAGLLDALATARAEAGEGDELAYRAVELAYLDGSVSNERAAERLALSRSSFYRALRRGVSGINAVLCRS